MVLENFHNYLFSSVVRRHLEGGQPLRFVVCVVCVHGAVRPRKFCDEHLRGRIQNHWIVMLGFLSTFLPVVKNEFRGIREAHINTDKCLFVRFKDLHIYCSPC